MCGIGSDGHWAGGPRKALEVDSDGKVTQVERSLVHADCVLFGG